jgi:hypothetical protein
MGLWNVKVVQSFQLLRYSLVVFGSDNLCWSSLLSFVISASGYLLIFAICIMLIHSLSLYWGGGGEG